MLIAVCSAKGAPGVTTISLALAACWPHDSHPVVVEYDPHGGDIAARFGLHPSPGLLSLAAAARQTSNPSLLWRHTQRLPGGLPVVAAPVAASQTRSAQATLNHPGQVNLFRLASALPEAAVIVDCGRITPANTPLVELADVVVMVCRPLADELSHVATLIGEPQRWHHPPELILVGNGYPAKEVRHQLGVSVLGTIPHDARGAAMLRGHQRRTRRNSLLLKAIRPIVTALLEKTSVAHHQNLSVDALKPAPSIPPSSIERRQPFPHVDAMPVGQMR